jgi:hypothetical protein
VVALVVLVVLVVLVLVGVGVGGRAWKVLGQPELKGNRNRGMEAKGRRGKREESGR